MNELSHFLGRYLIELSLIEIHMGKYSPSLIAASAGYLTRKILKLYPAWNNILDKYSRAEASQLRECAKDLLIIFQSAQIHTLTAVKDKFSQMEFLEVSKISV